MAFLGLVGDQYVSVVFFQNSDTSCTQPLIYLFIAIALSPLLLANAGLTPGSIGSISTLKTANIQVVECERVVLIYDLKGNRASNNKGKGKEEVTDSFFEAYVREVVGEPCFRVFPSRW